MDSTLFKISPKESPTTSALRDVQLMSTMIGEGESRWKTASALLPYYIEPMVFGRQDATVVVKIRGLIPLPLIDLVEDMFNHPTITSFRYREVHDSYVEIRTRMGLFHGTTDQRPIKEEIVHRDMIQVS